MLVRGCRTPRGHYNSPILSYGGSEGCESIAKYCITYG